MSQENFTADPQDVQANKVMAILAYFGLFVLIPLFAAKESPFARFHTNQGLILLIAGFVIGLASMVKCSARISAGSSRFWANSAFLVHRSLCIGAAVDSIRKSRGRDTAIPSP